MNAHAHEPTGEGSWKMKCTAPNEGKTAGNTATLSGAPPAGTGVHILAEEFSSGWLPEDADIQYKWVFWGYLKSRAKSEDKVEKDEPEFKAGGNLGRLTRERADASSPYDPPEWMNWNSSAETWDLQTPPVTDVLEAGLRPCPSHTRNACVVVDRGSGAISSHEEGDADSNLVGGMKSTIPISANGSSVTGKAKFTTPGWETGEISITVTYTAVK
jgi:hypothetical protein